MIRAFGGGIVFPPGATGVTRLTETDFATGVEPLGETVSVPVFAPGGRFAGFAVTVRVVPLGPIVPDEGETLRYDLSVEAVNPTSSACLPLTPGMNTFIVTGVVLPTGVVTSPCRPVTVGTASTTIETVGEFGPGAPLQLL